MNTLLIDDRRITHRNDKIDFLRFLLAVSVLLVHLIPWASFYGLEVDNFAETFNKLFSKFFQPKNETNPAVLGFIVLSGYCIHRNGLRKDYFPIKPYLIKRFFRIFPVYILGMILGVLVFLQFGYFDQKIQAITSTNAVSLWGSIIKLIGISALFPFGYKMSYQGNGPLITAAVEFWLYLVYPIVIVLLSKYSEKRFWKILILLNLLGVVGIIFFPAFKTWWHNGSLLGFLLYWYIGAKFVSYSFYHSIKKKQLHIVLIFLILSIILIYFKAELYILVEIKKIALAFCFGLVLRKIDTLSASNLQGYNVKFKLWDRFWHIFIGCSYSIYALHTPLIVVGFVTGLKVIHIVLLVVVLSLISYAFFEKPLIDYSKLLAKKFYS